MIREEMSEVIIWEYDVLFLYYSLKIIEKSNILFGL